jgi:hypothetical protein
MITRRSSSCSLAGIVTLTSMAETADAWPFRRSRASISRARVDRPCRPESDAEFSHYRRLRAFYNYELASSDDVAFADRIRVFLRVQEPSVLEATEPVVAEVKITDLSDHESTQVKFIPVKFTQSQQAQEKLAVFDVTNNGEQTPLVQPAKVYRIYVNLHRESEQYGAEYGVRPRTIALLRGHFRRNPLGTCAAARGDADVPRILLQGTWLADRRTVSDGLPRLLPLGHRPLYGRFATTGPPISDGCSVAGRRTETAGTSRNSLSEPASMAITCGSPVTPSCCWLTMPS